MSHLSIETILDYVRGRGTGADKSAAVAHFATCGECVDLLHDYKKLVLKNLNARSICLAVSSHCSAISPTSRRAVYAE